MSYRAITVVPAQPLSVGSTGSSSLFRPDIVIDGQDRVHVGWVKQDFSGITVTDVHYAQVSATGVINVTDRVLASSSAAVIGSGALAVDAAGDVHAVLTGQLDAVPTCVTEVFYLMLDGGTGDTRIAPTLLTQDDCNFNSSADIAALSSGEIAVVYDDFTISFSQELYLRRINPALDNRDGSAADAVAITTLPATVITADDGVPSMNAALVADSAGDLRIAFMESFQDVGYTVVDANGLAVVPATALTVGQTAGGAVPGLSVGGPTSYVTWDDSARGRFEPVLRVIN